jgi:hypothetical protein
MSPNGDELANDVFGVTFAPVTGLSATARRFAFPENQFCKTLAVLDFCETKSATTATPAATVKIDPSNSKALSICFNSQRHRPAQVMLIGRPLDLQC